MRHRDMIGVRGANGDYCIITHKDLSWGPILAPGSKGLFDMPIETFWGRGPFGSFFQSWRPKARDVQWTINIMNPQTGTMLDQDEALWHTIYSRWKAMFSPAVESTVEYMSLDGMRTLGLRTVVEPQPFSSLNFEGHDPHLWSFGSVVQSQRAELPFYVGKPDRYSHSIDGVGNFWFPMPYFNPASADCWAEWDLSGGADWILPDYSYGLEAYGRGVSDMGKKIGRASLV
jgi:hypothetical protein